MLRIPHIEQLDPTVAKFCAHMSNGQKVTVGQIRTVLHFSSDTTWRTLRKLESIGWIRHENRAYSANLDKLGKLNPYDTAYDVLIGSVARKLLILARDFGPISSIEMSKLVGAPEPTVRRQIRKLNTSGIIASGERGGWHVLGSISEPTDPIMLWPQQKNHQKLRQLATRIGGIAPSAPIIIYGAPELNIVAVCNSLDLSQVRELGEAVTESLNDISISPDNLLIPTKHAWLRELHRLHKPPSIALRNALFGLAIYGSKPRHDFAELFRAYISFTPLTDKDKELWLRRRWITIRNGVPEFTPLGARIGPIAEAVQETVELHKVTTEMIFA